MDGKYRMVQDLHLGNDAVRPCVPVVANPSTILSEIPPDSCFIILPINLAFFFFSIPVRLDRRY